MKKLFAAASAGILLLGATPVLAQGQWAGPRLGSAVTYGWGTAEHVFLTDGFFNDNPGDTFTAPVRGYPFEVTAGYDWQEGRLVYGLGITLISGRGGISNYEIESPYDPDQGFDVKFHWASTVTARAGIAAGRTLVYAEAGLAFIHLINEANDDVAGRVRLGDWPVGMTAGVGVERAFGPHLSANLGYQFISYMPASVYQSNAGPTPTDYTVRLNAHLITAGTTWHFDPIATAGGGTAVFDWGGLYAGNWAQSPIASGGTVGYNLVLGDAFVIGSVGRFGKVFCCAHGWTWDAMGRAGILIEDDLLLYAEGGIRARSGNRFYGAGGGLEFVMSRRFTGFMQMQGITRPGEGFREAAFTGGINFHIGQ